MSGLGNHAAAIGILAASPPESIAGDSTRYFRVSRNALCSPLTIGHPGSLEASLFVRMATTRPADAGWIASVSDAHGLDWDRLTKFALLENGATLLDDRVSRLPNSLVPACHRERIDRLGLIWTFKLKFLEQRLKESLEVLGRAGIEVVLLKGAALAITTHRSFTDRPMADIDMMVDPSKARDAHLLLQQHGWTPDSSGHPDNAWTKHHHLLPLADKKGSGLRLEIHIAPLPPGHPYNLDFTGMRATAQVMSLDGLQVLVPEIHTYAIHSAIHFAWSHRFESGAFNAFGDLAALESTGRFSWNRLIEMARQASAETCCYWTLRLAKSLADFEVPDAVLKQLAPPITEPFLSLLEQHFSQLVLRSERACPSVGLRFRVWSFAMQTTTSMNEESLQWDIGVRARPPRRMRFVRRLGSHLRRTRQWSLYLASMVAALPARA
jgi:Uncharacterised nucleotidyltransferase